MRKILLAAAAILAMSATAHADSEPYIGEIQTYPFNFCPVGWLPTDGRSVSVTGYNPLFALIGTTYGGNGIDTFKLPWRAKPKTVDKIKVTECIAVLGIFPSRS